MRPVNPVVRIMKMKTIFLPALLALLCGCASFNSGDVLVERSTAQAMLSDTTITPFADIQVSWLCFPYRSPTDSIGEGSASRPVLQETPLPALPEDISQLTRRAREIYANAGLYDKAKGRGTLRLKLTTLNRWTYADLWSSYIVDTGFIFILPSSLRTKYLLDAEFAVSSGTVRVETAATRKTTFHLLMAPLYPFFAPGARESSLLKQILWRSATDVYSELKRHGGTARELPPPQAEAAKAARSQLAGPPVNPDRDWKPGAAQESSVIAPETPDKTWEVQGQQSQAPQQQIKPEPADKGWEAGQAVQAAPQPSPAPAAAQAAIPDAVPAATSPAQNASGDAAGTQTPDD